MDDLTPPYWNLDGLPDEVATQFMRENTPLTDAALRTRLAEVEAQLKTVLDREADNIRRADAKMGEVEAERDVYKVALERITKFNFDFLEAFHLSARECREVARAALGAKP